MLTQPLCYSDHKSSIQSRAIKKNAEYNQRVWKLPLETTKGEQGTMGEISGEPLQIFGLASMHGIYSPPHGSKASQSKAVKAEHAKGPMAASTLQYAKGLTAASPLQA